LTRVSPQCREQHRKRGSLSSDDARKESEGAGHLCARIAVNGRHYGVSSCLSLRFTIETHRLTASSKFCGRFDISKATLYRYVGPDGERRRSRRDRLPLLGL
jgi:3-methyladenine DNA glycosylase Mpg